MGLAGPTLAPPGLPERLRRSDPAGGHGPRAGSGPAGRGLAPSLPDLVLGAGLPGLSPPAALSPPDSRPHLSLPARPLVGSRHRQGGGGSGLAPLPRADRRT